MYNEAQKVMFVKGKTENVNVRVLYQKVFNATEKYEQAWGADLCTRSKEELQTMLEGLSNVRLSAVRSILTVLHNYGRWCLEQQIPGACDGLIHVELPSGVERMRVQTVRNPRHLQSCLDKICRKESDETKDNVLRCYLWLAYGGMKEQDALRVRTSDVDFSNQVVRFEGKEYPIYREAIPAFRNCVRLTQFAVFNPASYGSGSGDESYHIERSPGKLLLRAGRGSDPSLSVLRALLSKRKKDARDECGVSEDEIECLRYYRVWISGVFYRMYENELAGDKPDFRDFVLEKKGDKTYKLDSGRNTQKARRAELARGYLADYNRWKQTLSL